ncbi:hypothetical protein LCGC14_1543810 [marine sediment metagenome]|uniref:Uncharacterized protein n=1 Tax=marine sediment metagenome TaxID=412755 RepID=A0A0F9LT05_9ZZZZ|nr:hypothetical protein [Candidatus Anoxychlamydiales bacterium]
MSTISLSAKIQREYVNKFPTKLPIKAAQSFVATGVISLIAGCSAVVALLAGSIAILATTIEALTRPIIKSIFPKNPFVGLFIQICIPEIMAFGLIGVAAPWLGVTYKVSALLLPLIAWLSLNNDFYEKNTAQAVVF